MKKYLVLTALLCLGGLLMGSGWDAQTDQSGLGPFKADSVITNRVKANTGAAVDFGTDTIKATNIKVGTLFPKTGHLVTHKMDSLYLLNSSGGVATNNFIRLVNGDNPKIEFSDSSAGGTRYTDYISWDRTGGTGLRLPIITTATGADGELIQLVSSGNSVIYMEHGSAGTYNSLQSFNNAGSAYADLRLYGNPVTVYRTAAGVSVNSYIQLNGNDAPRMVFSDSTDGGARTLDSLCYNADAFTFSGAVSTPGITVGAGGAITKIVKVGSHLAIILGTDTLWAAKDTSGF
jgi:hypothetical protein